VFAPAGRQEVERIFLAARTAMPRTTRITRIFFTDEDGSSGAAGQGGNPMPGGATHALGGVV
jgi:hypothetical protein